MKVVESVFESLNAQVVE